MVNKLKKIAFQLLDEGLIHVIATDTHRATGSRKPCLNKIFYLLEKNIIIMLFIL